MTNGTITTIAGTGIAGYNGDALLTTIAQLNNPTGVAIDSNGAIYISDTGNNRIRKLSIPIPRPDDYQCFNIAFNNFNVCSSHGACISQNNCSCLNGYTGELCSERISSCPIWDNDALSAQPPSIESTIIGDGIKFTTTFVKNDQVDFLHQMYIGESNFESSSCSIIGNESISLTELPQSSCSKIYETLVLTIDHLLKDSNVKKELNGDYLKLTIPITLSYLDSTGISNNGFCRGYTFYTTQTIYFKIIANVFSSYQQDFKYIYGVKVYPQSFTSNSDEMLVWYSKV